MKKTTKTYDIFKMEESNKNGRVVTVGYCIYRVADGERFKSYIPTRAMAVEMRDRMNADAEAQRVGKLTPVTIEEAGRLLASVS